MLPWGVTVTPNSQQVYVANTYGDNVSRINVASGVWT